MDRHFVFTNQLKFFEIEEKGKKRFFIKGAFSSDDLDLVNDICTKNCLVSMVKQMKSGRIKLDFEHEAFRGETKEDVEINKTRQVLAKAIDAKMNGSFAEATWELNENYKKLDSKGDVVLDFKMIKEDVQRGFYDAFSIAYIPTKIGHKTMNGEDVRLLDDVRLLNVALTGNPVNTFAQIRNVFTKSMDAMDDFKAEKKNNPELGDKVEVKDETEAKRESGSSREKRKIRKEAINDDGSDDDAETKKKKYEDKSYEKDGAHAHTEAEPLGLHNHPEIEERIAELIQTLDRRLDFVHERITEMQEGKEKSEIPIMAKDNKSHSNENLDNNQKEVKKMEEKENENEGQAPASEEGKAPEASAPAEASKEEPLNEVKSMLKDILGNQKAMDARLTLIEAKDAEDVKAPESKANSKAVQNNTQTHGIQAKAVLGAGLSEL